MQILSLFVFLILFHFPALAACTDPGGMPGELMYNGTHDVFQGCTTRGWMAFHAASAAAPPPPGPAGCPNIGDMCNDGTIYAGQHEGQKLYVTAEDAPGSYSWNNGNPAPWNTIDLDNSFMPNCPSASPRYGMRYSDITKDACTGAKGKQFTEYLAQFTGGGSPYKAAQYCYNLGSSNDPLGANNPAAHGYDDWFLPAIDELEHIYDNLGPEPNHAFKSGSYASSTEADDTNAWVQTFTASGFQPNVMKTTGYHIRCARRQE